MKRALCVLVALLVSGCATLFPSAPIERAADRVIDEILNGKARGGDAARTDAPQLPPKAEAGKS